MDIFQSLKTSLKAISLESAEDSQWDESKHPRGNPSIQGQFAKNGEHSAVANGKSESGKGGDEAGTFPEKKDNMIAKESVAMDSYNLKPGEKWVTTKKGHHRVVVNEESGEVVFGSPHVLMALKSGEESVGHNVPSEGWESVSRSDRWRGIIDGMKGADPYTARNAVDMLVGKLSPKMFALIPQKQRETVAEKSIGIIGAYLHNFGGKDFPASLVAKAQNSIGESVPSMKEKWPEFFSPDFYDSVSAYHAGEMLAAESRSKDIRDVVKMADAAVLPEEAKDALIRIDEASVKYGDMDALRTARERVKAISKGEIPGDLGSNGTTHEYKPLQDPSFPTSLSEVIELPTPASFAKGYTKPKLVVDRNGKKWVLKEGGARGHAQAEHETSEVYRKLGILAPASKMYGDVRLSEYIEGQELGTFMKTASDEEKKRVLDELRSNFAADIVLGNHDLIGDEEDNVMIGEDGRVWRVDNGGALGKKGAGEDDESFSGGWIDDLWTMRGLSPRINGDMEGVPQNPQLSRYFGSMDTNEVLQQAASMPLEKVIDHLQDSKFADMVEVDGKKGQRVRVTKGRKEIVSERIKEIRALAATSKGTIEDGRYITEYNDRLLKMTYALSRTPFRELASQKSSSCVPLIYDATADGFVRNAVSGTFNSAHSASKLAKETVKVNNMSLDSILKETAANEDIDLSRTDKMFDDQGHSTSICTHANKLKVMELVGMGYTLRQISSGAVPDLSNHIKRRVQLAAMDYIRDGGEDGQSFGEDIKAMMFRKAATMLFFQNAGLPNYDPRTQRIMCVRTESASSLGDDVLQHKGEVLPAYPRDSHASYSWYQTCTPTNSNHLVAVSIPISRISSCDLFTNMVGKNLFNQYHRLETELGANAFGLPFVYLGKTEKRIPIRNFFLSVSNAEKRSGKTLAGEACKDDKSYLKAAAPWAKASEES